MVDKSALMAILGTRLKKLPVGHAIDLRTYKRDRSVVIVRVDGERFRVIEEGFEQQEFFVDRDKLDRLLKTLVKREFPRSNKIRLYQLGAYRG